jgi:VanZ family protein
LRTRSALWVTAFWLAVLAGIAVSLMPAPPLPDPWFPAADKVQHAVAYAVLFLLGRHAGYGQRTLMLGLLALGAAIEVAQGALTATRSAEWLDLVADALGVGFGHLIAMAIERSRLRSARVEQVHRR